MPHTDQLCLRCRANNLGALIAFSLTAYICQYGLGSALGGQQWGFFVGFAISAAASLSAIVVFLAGTKSYRRTPATEGLMGNFCAIVKDALMSVTYGSKAITEGEPSAPVKPRASSWLDR